MAKRNAPTAEEQRLREELHEREVRGAEDLPAGEREELVEAAESNPDPTTRRETIEQELMELRESEKGSEIGD